MLTFAGKEKATGTLAGSALGGAAFAGTIGLGVAGGAYDIASFLIRPELWLKTIGAVGSGIEGAATVAMTGGFPAIAGAFNLLTKNVSDQFWTNPGYNLGYVAANAIAIGVPIAQHFPVKFGELNIPLATDPESVATWRGIYIPKGEDIRAS
jgi:hypothetical protein